VGAGKRAFEGEVGPLELGLMLGELVGRGERDSEVAQPRWWPGAPSGVAPAAQPDNVTADSSSPRMPVSWNICRRVAEVPLVSRALMCPRLILHVRCDRTDHGERLAQAIALARHTGRWCFASCNRSMRVGSGL
jgi:hypothetical protein